MSTVDYQPPLPREVVQPPPELHNLDAYEEAIDQCLFPPEKVVGEDDDATEDPSESIPILH